MNNNNYWEDYWATDGKSGEVFVDSRGNKPTYLKEFWKTCFLSNVKEDESLSVVDLASGAGAIFNSLDENTRSHFELTGVDLSQTALDILKKKLPECEVFRKPTESTGFENESFDFVVSQFGVEYAGMAGFEEAARILSRQGEARFLCHHKNGYIDQRNESFLAGANAVVDSSFIDRAKDLVKKKFDPSIAFNEDVEKLFSVAKDSLAAQVQSNSEGIHTHLFHGFEQLSANYKKYHENDILKWLDDMAKDIDKNILKVNAIRKVSLEERDIERIKEIFKNKGFVNIDTKLLYPPNEKRLPIAWDIVVKK